MSEKFANFNFKEYRRGTLKGTDKNRFVRQYYDEEHVVLLTIFPSGWKKRYNCVLEWGEYQDTHYELYAAQEIEHFYGIKTFLRKEKLDIINSL